MGRQKPLVKIQRAERYPKFRLFGDDQKELLADYLPYCSAVRVHSRMPRIPRCRDPFDVPFLELAIAGKAEYLVTGDKVLPGLAGRFTCPIVTPQGFIETLSRAERS